MQRAGDEAPPAVDPRDAVVAASVPDAYPTGGSRSGGSGSGSGSRAPPVQLLPPLSPKLQSSLSGIALSNLARNFSIGTPPHTPHHAPTAFAPTTVPGAAGDSLTLTSGIVMTGGSIADARPAGGSPPQPGASSRHLHDFSQSNASLAPLGIPARRVDTDDELLQQQVLWEVDLSELDFSGQKVLGRGAYGEVILSKWRSLPVAIKRCVRARRRLRAPLRGAQPV